MKGKRGVPQPAGSVPNGQHADTKLGFCCDGTYDPDCAEHYYSEAVVDGNGTRNPNIADLVHLVTYMFQDGVPLIPCP